MNEVNSPITGALEGVQESFAGWQAAEGDFTRLSGELATARRDASAAWENVRLLKYEKADVDIQDAAKKAAERLEASSAAIQTRHDKAALEVGNLAQAYVRVDRHLQELKDAAHGLDDDE